MNAKVQPEPVQIKTTGLNLLDKALGGGLPSGSVVYISSDAASNAEALLFHFSQPGKTFYFAISREPKYIINDMKHLGLDISNIVFVDVFNVAHHHSLKNEKRQALIKSVQNDAGQKSKGNVDYDVLEFLENKLKNIKDRDATLIIDAFHIIPLLDVKMNSIRELMHMIYNTAKENDDIVYLFTLRNTMESRIENELMGYCDVIFDMSSKRHEGTISNELAITKARNVAVVSYVIKFFIKGRVLMDPSELIV